MVREKFVVAVASRAVFDFEDEHAVYESEGLEAYLRLQAGREGVLPALGPAYGLVDGLARINAASPDPAYPLIDIVVVSRNDPCTGLRFLDALSGHGLGASRCVMTGGRDVAGIVAALGADLFVTRSPGDGRAAALAGVPSAVLAEGSPHVPFEGELRVALDGDAVLFDDSSERAFLSSGYLGWHAYELDNAEADLGPGPLDRFARKLSALRPEAGSVGIDIRLALVTARDGAARARPVRSLRRRGIGIDAGFFLGGLCKGDAMGAFRPHMFLDDKAHHVAAVARFAPAGLVPGLGEGTGHGVAGRNVR